MIFVKAPAPGRVKTRLCPPLTSEQAADLYREFAADTLAAAQRWARGRGAIRLAYDAHPRWPDPSWLDAEMGWQPQRGRSLGARLIDACRAAFAAGAGPLVILGSDAPDLSVERLQEAFAALRTHELVLGPATDGGYYLIGLRRPQPALFRGIDWSTDRVLRQTLAVARRQRLRTALLAPLTDLDTWADVVAWRRRGGRAAPRTRRWLTEAQGAWSRTSGTASGHGVAPAEVGVCLAAAVPGTRTASWWYAHGYLVRLCPPRTRTVPYQVPVGPSPRGHAGTRYGTGEHSPLPAG